MLYNEDEEEKMDLKMTFDSDGNDSEDDSAGRAPMAKEITGGQQKSTAAVRHEDSDSDEDAASTWTLPAQTHRINTRLRGFSHRGLRAIDDKCALKHHLEGTGCMPESYDLPTEAEAFLEAAKEDREAIWIWKEAKMAKGLGIKLLPTLQEATSAAKEPGKLRAVAQRYLEPLLMGGVKWDLRLYVLLTSLSPVECFLYNEGFARFCGAPYPSGGGAGGAASVGDLGAHLTNTAVSDGRGTIGGDANVIPTSSLWVQLASMGHDTEAMQCSVRRLLERVFAKVGPAVAKERKTEEGTGAGEFSLLGVDVILDSSFHPWLLEINYNPDMTCHSLSQKPIKTQLVHDIYDLVMKREGEARIGEALEEVADVDAMNWTAPERERGQCPPLLGGWSPLLPLSD